MDAVQDYGGLGCFIAFCICIVEDLLNLDWGKLSTNCKGFDIRINGLPAFCASRVDELVPGQVCGINFNFSHLKAIFWVFSNGLI